jgi:serine/threonine-protein kinase
MIRSIALFGAAATLLLAFAGAAPAADYRGYANARFGTAADVPTGWRADPEPANGDGLVFRSPDGKASVTVSGSLHVWDSIDEAMKIYEEPQQGETITYRHREPRVLVVSGTRGDTIFYARHILSCRDQIWNSVHIEYPAAQKAAYDAMVTHIARSLHGGPNGTVPKCR